MCVVKQNIYLILKYQNKEYPSVHPCIQKESAALQPRIRIHSPLPSIHLPPIMPPDAPYRLPQGISPAVQMVADSSGSVGMVGMKYDHRSPLRILRIMQIPVMAGIPAHDRHIIGIRDDDAEILRIQAFQVFTAEHRQPPSQQTTHPEPS